MKNESRGVRVKSSTISRLIDAKPEIVKAIKTEAGDAAKAAAKQTGAKLQQTEDTETKALGSIVTAGSMAVSSGIAVAQFVKSEATARVEKNEPSGSGTSNVVNKPDAVRTGNKPVTNAVHTEKISDAVRVGQTAKISESVRINKTSDAVRVGKTNDAVRINKTSDAVKTAKISVGNAAKIRVPVENTRIGADKSKIHSLKTHVDAPVTTKQLIAERIKRTNINTSVESGVKTKFPHHEDNAIKDISARSIVKGVNGNARSVNSAANTIGSINIKGAKGVSGAVNGAKGLKGVKVASARIKSAVKIGGKTGAKKAVKTAISLPGKMSGSQDETIQGIGKIYTKVESGIRTGVKGAKTVTKAGRSIATRVSKAKATKAATKAAAKAATKAATGSVIHGAGVTTTAMTASAPVLPWVLLAAAIVIMVVVIVTCVLGSGSIFMGSSFTMDGEEISAEDYLKEEVPILSEALKAGREMESEDIVRLYDETGALTTEITISDDEIIETLTPLFSSLLLTKNYEVTSEEAETLVTKLFNSLVEVIETDSYEYCGQDLATGEGTPIECAEESGVYHALPDCPNSETVYHAEQLCSECVETEAGFACEHCEGHSVKTYRISLGNLGDLRFEYLDLPIDELNGYETLSDEQETQLDLLVSAREIFDELCNEYEIEASETNVVFDVSGNRVGCQTVVDLALSQLGNNEADGSADKYVQLLGFSDSKGTSWCACFVNWCMRNCQEADPYYPVTANNAYCPTVADWFKSHGQWGDRYYTDLVPGDIIFYDFYDDGEPHHIGIVIGISGSTVYVVEGNKSDKVDRRSVTVGSSSIYGYGLMIYGRET